MQDTQQLAQQLLGEVTGVRRTFAGQMARLDAAEVKLRELEDQFRQANRSMPSARELTGQLREHLRCLRSEGVEALAKQLGNWQRALRCLGEGLGHVATLASLGELSASVAHEIRNPLFGMMLSAEVLQTKMDPDDSRLRLLENLRRDAERMKNVVENLLQLSRSYKPRVESCDVGDLVRKSVQSVHSSLKKNDIRVRVRAAPGCRANLGADLVQQVFRNIVLNAVDASPPGSALEIAVDLHEEADSVSVTFKDQGAGIAPEMLGKLFEPFVTSKHNGLGLGLAVSKRIMDAHGGTIEARGEPGQGATFIVTFPRMAATPKQRAAA